MSRIQQFKFNSRCAWRGLITLQWHKLPFHFAGLSRAVRGT